LAHHDPGASNRRVCSEGQAVKENRPVAQSPRISSFASTRLRTKTSGSGSSIGK
jgi:hypothetical protein